MPYINTKTNLTISKEAEQTLAKKYGAAITLLPGKSEAWLMLNFEDNCKMYFRGEDTDSIAFVEIKVYGGAPKTAYEKLTAQVTEILGAELSIQPQNIYVKYEEIPNWGFNGANF